MAPVDQNVPTSSWRTTGLDHPIGEKLPTGCGKCRGVVQYPAFRIATSGPLTSRTSDGLQGGQEFGERVAGVAEQQGRPGVVEELVLDAGEAGAHGAFEEDDSLRLVSVQDGHAVDRGAGGVAGRRVHDVVGADDQDDVRGLEVAVDLVHL